MPVRSATAGGRRMVGRRRRLDRLAALAGALLIAACSASTAPPGSAPGPGQSEATASAAAGSEAPSGPTFPPIDPASISKAAKAEVDLVHALQSELAVAKAVGSDGAATLQAVDADEQAFGEAWLPEAARAGGLDLGATGEVQLAAFRPGSLHAD